MRIDSRTFDRLLQVGNDRIAQIYKEQGGPYRKKDIITLPFRCWGCNKMRYDFCLINGDGICMCMKCMQGMLPEGATNIRGI